jgi:hypothetical protein
MFLGAKVAKGCCPAFLRRSRRVPDKHSRTSAAPRHCAFKPILEEIYPPMLPSFGSLASGWNESSAPLAGTLLPDKHPCPDRQIDKSWPSLMTLFRPIWHCWRMSDIVWRKFAPLPVCKLVPPYAALRSPDKNHFEGSFGFSARYLQQPILKEDLAICSLSASPASGWKRRSPFCPAI